LSQKVSQIGYSVLLFIVAGLCEIGGGYLVWLWLREDFSWVLGAVGGFVLFLYGIVPTFQKTHFHRVYAAYGGVFIAMAVFWGWLIDGVNPDNYDILGSIIAIIGVLIIFYFPRKGEKFWK
jgi:small multidrug resistance family-3 protein